MGDQSRAGDLMRKSLCWTGVLKPGSADDRLRITMTVPGGTDDRTRNSEHPGVWIPGAAGGIGECTEDCGDDAPLVLTGRLWPTFAARTVVLTPGSALPFAEADWTDALIVIESGELEVETLSGLCRRFRAGEILWFAGLDLRILRSSGAEPTVLKAVSRAQRD